MFCPQCGSGYRAGFTRCNDCDTDLVDTLPAPAEIAIPPSEPEHSADYVPITKTQGQLQTSQVRSFLESNGIASEVQAESMYQLYGITADGMSASRILVPREQAATAIELLEQANHGDLTIDAEEETTGPYS